MSNQHPSYSLGEEIANSVTHGIGLALSIAGLVMLIIWAAMYGTAIHIVSYTIFGSSLILLYTASTLYHAFPQPRVKAFFKVIDHSAIYLLIAGTYTPFMLAHVGGAWGWSIFGIIWGLAVLGIGMKVFFIKRFKIISVLTYIGMGWLVVVAFPEVMDAIPTISLILLITGGVTYTLGTIFYAWKGNSFAHPIWHLFVLAGSIQHYFAVMTAI